MKNELGDLPLRSLRLANQLRLPQFKNKHGELAHSQPDGSDWSPAQWFQAFIGECGEFARARMRYEDGEITYEEYVVEANKELADILTYLDILARRSLDTLDASAEEIAGNPSPAGTFMRVMAAMGDYANEQKKYFRGDNDGRTTHVNKCMHMEDIYEGLVTLTNINEYEQDHCLPHPCDSVDRASLEGVRLDLATVRKFNEVSKRVGSSIRIGDHGEVVEPEPWKG